MKDFLVTVLAISVFTVVWQWLTQNVDYPSINALGCGVLVAMVTRECLYGLFTYTLGRILKSTFIVLGLGVIYWGLTY